MLNAAEAQIDAGAKDEKEQARLRAKIYAPPKGVRGPSGRRQRPPATRMTAGDARALMAQASAQDAQARRGGG
ncbi:hypothetical protein GR925_27505 [Streptomyces sp. HUCO-GS316]|uniref:hypothetical protein n=1 Tax=Streptomyces sp. HUCO-GS316 TaxID=2692198 RepID=UPI00136D8E99|nr:hypothetical protein [Streptomyces sp. HUCO-GS316]MXM67076.1 hypothetical protein [Streptomyces sp. HUCO-GS316]